MSSNALVTQNPMLRNFENLWFLVQYDRNPTICVRKVIRSSDFISCQPVRGGNPESNLYFRIRQNGVKYLALLLFCSENEEDVLIENLLLKFSYIPLFTSQIDISVAVDDRQLQKELCYFAVYHRGHTFDLVGREAIFQIFNHKNVRLERDKQYLDVTNVFVEDQQITFEADLTKVDFTFGNLMDDLNHVRKMRPLEIDFQYMSSRIPHVHRTSGPCSLCAFIEMCMQRDAVRRVGLMNFQQFSKALLEQNK